MHIKKLAAEVGDLLREYRAHVSTAESCTGGGIAEAITSIPGSSAWYEYGFVTYSNTAKTQLLAVDKALIEAKGAVSEDVVKAMAEGALHKSGADISVAVSGVAGPDGGTSLKPVGTVWLAWATKGQPTRTCLSFFQGDRDSIREQTIIQALEGILAYLPR